MVGQAISGMLRFAASVSRATVEPISMPFVAIIKR
jgi:hypothetical protein